VAAGGRSTGVAVGKRRHRRRPVMSEINVTPMVDVMLVLLIIFMVAAPLLTTNIDIDLPTARGGVPSSSKEPPLALSVKVADGTCNSKVDMYLGDTKIPLTELEAKMKAVREARPGGDNAVFLRGDRNVCYTDMMKVLGYIRATGFKANIVIIPEEGS
jgi:biopolymer transport protein TolR